MHLDILNRVWVEGEALEEGRYEKWLRWYLVYINEFTWKHQ